MARIVVDYGRCSGLGVCESLNQRYFEISDEGKLLLPTDGAVDEADLELAREAVASCPTEALTLVED